MSATPGSEEVFTFAASLAQRRLWLLQQLDPTDASYNMPFALRLRGPLAVSALAASVADLAARHEVLRTTLEELDGELSQVIHPDRRPPLRVHEIPGEASIEVAAAMEAGRPFDLARDLPIRAALLRLGEEDHVLLLVIHHVAADGWSIRILAGELAALYAARTRGEEPALPEPELQYADYSEWQRRWLEGPAAAAQRAHWRSRLAGELPVLELPANRRRTVRRSRRGATRVFRPQPALRRALDELCRREGVTPFMALLAAFAALLHRISGQEEILVGTAFAGRDRPELERLVGYLVSSVVLRISLAGEPSFRELARRVKELTLEAHAHQELPLEQVVEALRLPRDQGHNPLFQVMFALEEVGEGGAALPGLRCEPIWVDAGTAKFDLTLMFEAGRGGDDALVGYLEHDAELFDSDFIARLTARYLRLLEAALADPAAPVAALDDLAPEERALIVGPWARGPSPPLGEASIPALVEAVARRAPSAPAVIHGAEEICFGALDARANQLAHRLRSVGIRRGARVGLCVAPSIHLVLGMLGILRAGAAYVPVDPAAPPARAAWILADAQVEAIVSHRAWTTPLPEGGPPRVDLDADGGALDAMPRSAPADAPALEDVAYVIYTSGSTGRPKGVAVPHRAILRLLLDTDYVALTADDRVAQLSNVAFDAATFEVWGALLAGAPLVGIPREVALLPRELAAALRELRVTALFLTTALFNQIVAEVPDAFATVRHVLFGGEAVDPRAARAALASGPPARLLHVYGPTETTTFATWQLVTEVPEGAATIPIGRPIANTTSYVLDRRLAPVGVGVPGELYLGGPGLAHGYLRRPGLTAARFVPDPHGDRPGARLYRTGDKVRWDAQGAIEFLGRFDHQVKIRGFRVELGEIEAALAAHPGVREAVVTTWEAAPGDRRLAAHVSPRPGAALDAGALRAHLRESIPEYMIPSELAVLPALPLGPTGKIDRQALVAASPIAATPGGAPVPPRTPVERILAAVWRETLGVDHVGVHDNFFELGGHSLLAARATSRAAERLGRRIPLRAIFERPTIAGLATRLQEEGDAAPADGVAPEPALAPVPRGEPLALSFAQLRLWILDQIQPGSAAYNVQLGGRLTGPLDPCALDRALAALVGRHEILRTRFAAAEDGTPRQVIADAPTPLIEHRSVDGAALEEREPLARAALVEHGTRPFDLAAAPPWRALLVRLAPDEHLFLWTMHHILVDGASMDLLLEELGACYRAACGLEDPPAAAAPLQYADHAAWQRRRVESGALDEQLAYWKRRLADPAPAFTFRGGKPPAERPSERGGVVARLLRDRTRAGLGELCRAHQVTPFMALLAVFKVVLFRLTEQRDLMVGTPIAGRDHPAAERMIGCFVNTLVLRDVLAPEMRFSELLAEVRETCLTAFASAEVPFDRVVEAVRPERAVGRTPLFQVMFVYNASRDTRDALRPLRLAPLDLPAETAAFDLSLTVADGAGACRLEAEYAADALDAAAAAGILEAVEQALARAAEAPDTRISDLPLAGPPRTDEAAQAPRLEARAPVVAEILAQARRAPAAQAIRHGARAVSYGALAAAVEQVARALRERGVGSGAVVGVLLDRSPAAIVALLAAHRAGAAYLPLDTGAPAGRVALILRDAGVRLVLTRPALRALLPDGVDALWCEDPAVTPEVPEVPEMPPGDLASRAGDQAAYVIYTSGSTGTPKGVVVSQRALAGFCAAARGRFALEPGDRVLQFAALGFDTSVEEIFPCLLAGGTLVLRSEAALRSFTDFLAEAAAHGITVLDLPTAYWSELAEHLARGQGALPPSVRLVIIGGEAARPAAVARWNAAVGARVTLLNTYGPTETTVAVTAADLTRLAAADAVPIGLPLDHARVALMDPWLQPVPPGLAGEITVTGDAVALGYLGRPASTALRFVPDPSASSPGARMYRTGDLARLDGERGLVYLGRLDDQVKIRGFRVEPGEVEAALRALPGVRACAVIPRRLDGDTRLVAFHVSDDGEAAQPALRAQLATSLPDYLVPAAFVALPALPVTPQGKVDRRALGAHPLTRPDAPASAGRAPSDPVEASLTAIWGELLGRDAPGVDDDFFALGGHSLLAMRLIDLVERRLGLHLEPAALFRAPTPAQLAAEISRRRDAEARSPLVLLAAGGEAPPVFLVHPVGGHVLCYRRLALALGRERLCYGLQAADDGAPDLRAMASRYVELVRAAAPGRPRALVGWSMGGVIAYEMARQLREAGEPAALLAVIDALPVDAVDMEEAAALAEDDLVEGLARELGLDPESVRAAVRGGALDLLAAPAADRLARGLSPARARALLELHQRNTRALYAYSAPASAERVTLIEAAERIDPAAPPLAERWRTLAGGGLEVHALPGDHYTLLEPPRVDALAALLRGLLARMI